ncbi:plasmid stabilization system [Brenneria sp. EniD312]|nr:plasmid stabilization system [Brenneria sp. EniD312]
MKLTPLAQEDMESIYLYGLLNFGEEAAERYLSKLENTFSTIAQYRVGTERHEIGRGIYSLPVSSHVIFFLYEVDTVIIVRILHQSQDAVRHLRWI